MLWNPFQITLSFQQNEGYCTENFYFEYANRTSEKKNLQYYQNTKCPFSCIHTKVYISISYNNMYCINTIIIYHVKITTYRFFNAAIILCSVPTMLDQMMRIELSNHHRALKLWWKVRLKLTTTCYYVHNHTPTKCD